MYRFGADKGRFFVMAALVVVLGGFLFLIVSPAGNAFLELVKDLPLLMLAAAAVVLLAALSVLSFRLSVRFYLRRRNGVYG